MKKLLKSYRDLLGKIWASSPFIVILTFALALVAGFVTPLNVWVNKHVFDDGLRVAAGEISMGAFAPYLILFVITLLISPLISDLFIFGYVEPRALLILNISYKGRMLEKLKRIKYEHMESAESMEVINKAFFRAIYSARHMFPMYSFNFVANTIGAVMLLYMFAQASPWLLLTILIPFALETWWSAKHSHNIYEELEHYWKRERSYGILAGFLKNRDYIYEGKLNDSSDYLIDTYRARLNARNREYESFFFKNLRRILLSGNITKIAILLNAILLIYFYTQAMFSIGTLISLLTALFTRLFFSLSGFTNFVKWSGYHIQFVNFYQRFFDLSEDAPSKSDKAPDKYDIEFRNVRFKYPGTERDILKGLTFSIRAGERISVVGENGEGKSTLIKLLLGLFEPDEGEILLGGRPISEYSRETRNSIFAPVFQDFTRYSITLRENIAVGNIKYLNDEAAIKRALEKAQAEGIHDLDTLLGRDFEGGTDMSGGQWQRVALARAFLGDKPVLILDEPTSQLDPMAESRLYAEFNELSKGKTAIFITHRLASTMITDRILVISEGVIKEQGTHEALMQKGGIYAEMFEAQRKWYKHEEASA